MLGMEYRHGKWESYLHESKTFLTPTVTEGSVKCLVVCGEDKLLVNVFISLRYVDMYQ